MILLGLAWHSLNDALKEDLVITPPDLGVFGKSVLCTASWVVFISSPFYSWNGVAIKVSSLAVAAFFLRAPRELVIYEHTQLWNPPFKKSFQIKALKAFSPTAEIVILLLQGMEEVVSKKSKRPEEREKIAEFILEKGDTLKALFLKKHPKLNRPSTLPTIEFTAMILAIQTDFEDYFGPGQIIKILKAKTALHLKKHEMEPAQYHFLKALNWNLRITNETPRPSKFLLPSDL